MTGAGAASLAFSFEDGFMGALTDEDSDGSTDYTAFGRDPTLSEVSLDNALQRLNEPGSVWSVESAKANFEGAVTVEGVIDTTTFPDIEDIVFNATDGSSNKILSAGRPQSATIFTGIDYLSGTTERALSGCIPQSFSIDYSEDSLNRFTLSMLYADEEKNASITPTNITQPSDGDSSASHDFDVSIDGTSMSMLQSATLAIDNISRFQRDGSPTPADAVIGAPAATLDTTGIYTGPSELELAYGGSGVSSPQDRMTGVPATVTIDQNGSNISTYNLSKVKPATLGWSDVVSADADMTEPVTWNVDGEDAVTVS